MKDLNIPTVQWQEITMVLAIAVLTGMTTLGVLNYLFDQVHCVYTSPDGQQDILHGYKACAPPSIALKRTAGQ